MKNITLEQLAKHYGVTRSSVKAWSIEKRLQRMADMRAGVLPHIHDLIAELSGACYRASCYIKHAVKFDVYTIGDEFGVFSVYYYTSGGIGNYIAESVLLTRENMNDAIAKVKGLCK